MKLQRLREENLPSRETDLPTDALDQLILRLAVETTVKDRLGVSPEAIHGRARGTPRVVFARHLTLYLGQTLSSASHSSVAAAFSCTRQVVAYAMRKVEERRDDQSWDRTIELLTAEASRHLALSRARLAAGIVDSGVRSHG